MGAPSMTALLLLALVPVIMWTVQSVLLRAAGLRLRWRIDPSEAPTHIRAAGRMTTQFCLFAVIACYPFLRQASILDYYRQWLPNNRTAYQSLEGAAAAVLCLALLYLVWLATDRVQIKTHFSSKKLIKRLTLLIPTALFGAFVEELLFRGVVMADLLRTPAAAPIAVPASALVFAAAHYVRAVKRRWTFPGHLALGLVLGLAFLRTGALWLPMGIHAGGIFMTMGTRPFFWYKGPAWLTGASIFPFAGAIGIVGLAVLAGFITWHYPG